MSTLSSNGTGQNDIGKMSWTVLHTRLNILEAGDGPEVGDGGSEEDLLLFMSPRPSGLPLVLSITSGLSTGPGLGLDCGGVVSAALASASCQTRLLTSVLYWDKKSLQQVFHETEIFSRDGNIFHFPNNFHLGAEWRKII